MGWEFVFVVTAIAGGALAALAGGEFTNEWPQILERIRRGERIEHYETERMRKDGGIVGALPDSGN